MARVGRLAGAILVETGREFYLVGNTKVPCDFAAAGFEPPGEIDALTRPFIRLSGGPSARVPQPCLVLDLEGEPLARLLADRLLVARNGAVSDRLWRLILGEDDDSSTPPSTDIDARWLAAVPAPIWRIVRDTVLKCT